MSVTILTQYNISIPIILVIEDLNTCDKLTKDFINFYLNQDSNDFLILTANSIPLYPPYVYLDPYEKDPYYNFQDNTKIKKYQISLYDTEEKISCFVQSILSELRKIIISSVSSKILKFLLNKTFGGNPQFIMKLILNIYDQNFLTTAPTLLSRLIVFGSDLGGVALLAISVTLMKVQRLDAIHPLLLATIIR